MSSEVQAPKRLPVVKLAAAAIVFAVAAVLVLRGVDLAALKNQFIGIIRNAGPWVFFAAMALLPAVGAPLTLFTLTAGEAFASRMSMGGVIAVALIVVAFNLALSYWVARHALRPLLTRLLQRYGYQIPRVTPDNALSVALLVRCTPGPPYPLQCFVLGIAEVPFRLYMIVSWLTLLPWVVGAIVLGQGLFGGNFGAVFTGIGVLVIATVAVQWLRRKYFGREN